MEQARRHLDFEIWVYVIMPEHVHLLIYPNDPDYEVRRILAALKRPVSIAARDHLIATNQRAWLTKLSVVYPSRRVFRFWQPGGGYDRNVFKKYKLRQIVDYVHANPVRRGLVETSTEWRWSSAGFWEGKSNVPIRMDHFEV